MKKRILSLLLTLVMILGMIPATTLTASAASDTTVSSGGAMNLTFDYNGYKLSWNQLQSGSTIELKITAPNASGVIEDVVGSDQELKYPEGNSVDLVSKLTELLYSNNYCYANPYYGKGTYTFTVMETKDGYLLNEDTLVISNFAPLVLGFDARMSLLGVNGYNVDYEFVIEEDYSEGSFSIPAIVHGYSGSYTVSKVSGPDHIIVDSDGTIHGSNGGTVKVKIVSGNHTVYRTFNVQRKAVSDKALNKLVMVGFGDLTYNQLGGNKKVTTFRGGTSSPIAGAVVGAEGFYDGAAFIYDAIGNVEDRASIRSIFGGNETLFDVKVYNLDAYDSSNKEASYYAGMVDSSTPIKVGRYAYIYHGTNPGYNDYDISDYKIVDYYTGETLASETIDFASFSEYFISPTYYVYDVKPEIHSVSVNGTSVADGASYNSNSKNVTIKTTYDSTLSAAMLEYGCTSVKALSQWYVNGVKVNKAAVSPVDNGNGTATKTLTHTLNSGDVLEIRNWLEVTWPDGTTDIVDERTTNVTYGGVKNVSVFATFSGTPANATSNTSGIKVSNTKWYKWVESGSTAGYVEMSASDTIKEGALYKCEVTVAEDGDKLASGYTVKINGHEAEKKYGTNHTWVYETRLEGTTRYVDVYDIDLPEAYTNPDFTYNDEEGAAYHWDVVQVEWFECDQDGHKLSDALPADYIFLTDSYYRVEVTVTPESNWQFHSSDLGFYINGKAAQYLFYYNSDYSNSVTGYAVYNTADLEGSYELFVYDDSLSGSAKNIYIKDGQYLGSDATAPSDTEPSGGYAYYKDGVLELNGYDNEKAHFIFEEAALELWLIGDNTIGAIYDNEWGMAGGNLETRQGNLVINANPGGKLVIASNPLDAYANIQVKDLYFKGGDLTSCLANGTYGAAVQLNSGNLYLEKGTAAYVSDTNDFATATKWDGTTDISTYDCVWLKTIGTCRVDFIDDDNTVLDMVRVTEGSTVSEPDAPVKEGYEFIGWYTDDGDKFDFSTPITEDIALTAKFEPAASNITVNCIGDIDYTVSGNVVTVDHEVACKVGYLDGTAYKAITAVANGDGTYSFTAPAGVTEVLLVVKGDISGEGTVNAADKMAVARSMLLSSHPAYQALTAIQTFAADTDNVNGVNAADKMAIARSMLLTSHPAYQALTW